MQSILDVILALGTPAEAIFKYLANDSGNYWKIHLANFHIQRLGQYWQASLMRTVLDRLIA